MTMRQSSQGIFIESSYVSNIEQSSTMAVAAAVGRMKAEGIDIVDMGAGEPDFATPENVKDAAKRAIDEDFTRYTAVGGAEPLKRAVIEMINRDFRVTYQPSEVLITAGGKQGIFNGMASLLNPGDHVLIASPFWVTFPEITRFLQAEPVFIDTEPTGFLLTADQVRAAITPRTRLLIINSPNNPTGRVISPADFQRIVEIAAENDIFVLSDECYLHFVYSPAAVYSAAQLPDELRERVLVCGSFSKTYAMTGWRVGFALAPAPWINSMLKIQSNSTSNVNSIAQKAAIEAALGARHSLDDMLAEYGRRREWIIPALNSLPGVVCGWPDGAFYAFPNVSAVMEGRVRTSADLATLLLNEAHVAVTPGSAFGAEGYLRLSYANSMDALKRGLERIERVLATL